MVEVIDIPVEEICEEAAKNVLQFFPRSEYDQIRWKRLAARINASNEKAPDAEQLTEQEIYRIYFGETQSTCLNLVRFYKATGVWSAALDKQMVEIVKQLQAMCQTMAKTKPESKNYNIPIES